MLFLKRVPERRVFGFKCSPRVAEVVRSLARRLRVPISTVGEHCLEVGAAHVEAALVDKAVTEALETHLVERHFLSKTLEGVSEYDEKAISEAHRNEVSRLELEGVGRHLAGMMAREGLSPRLLLQVAQGLIARRRERPPETKDYENKGGQA